MASEIKPRVKKVTKPKGKTFQKAYDNKDDESVVELIIKPLKKKKEETLKIKPEVTPTPEGISPRRRYLLRKRRARIAQELKKKYYGG